MVYQLGSRCWSWFRSSWCYWCQIASRIDVIILNFLLCECLLVVFLLRILVERIWYFLSSFCFWSNWHSYFFMLWQSKGSMRWGCKRSWRHYEEHESSWKGSLRVYVQADYRHGEINVGQGMWFWNTTCQICSFYYLSGKPFTDCQTC